MLSGREVPSGLVDDEHGVPGGHLGGDFGEVQLHRLGVAGGQDERGSLSTQSRIVCKPTPPTQAAFVRERGDAPGQRSSSSEPPRAGERRHSPREV